MKIESSPLTLVLASLLALTAVDNRAVAQGPTVAAKSSSATQETGARGIEGSVKVPTEPVTLAAFIFSITFTNRTSKPEDFIEIGSIPRCVIAVFTKDGRECERTPAGDNVVGLGAASGFSTAIITIAPGQSHTWEIPLRELFVLKPGKYRMTVRLGKRPEKGEKGVEFTIRS